MGGGQDRGERGTLLLPLVLESYVGELWLSWIIRGKGKKVTIRIAERGKDCRRFSLTLGLLAKRKGGFPSPLLEGEFVMEKGSYYRTMLKKQSWDRGKTAHKRPPQEKPKKGNNTLSGRISTRRIGLISEK